MKPDFSSEAWIDIQDQAPAVGQFIWAEVHEDATPVVIAGVASGDETVRHYRYPAVAGVASSDGTVQYYHYTDRLTAKILRWQPRASVGGIKEFK